MKISPSYLVAFAILSTSCVHAQDLPIRKSGFWEMVVPSAPGNPPLIVKQCVDSDMEKRLGYDWMHPNHSGLSCDRPTITNSAGEITSKSTCKKENATIKRTTTITGYMDESYKIVTNSIEEPASSRQTGNSTTTITATFRGQCPADMLPGDLTSEIRGVKGQALPKMNAYSTLQRSN
jgi:hypothetical protein